MQDGLPAHREGTHAVVVGAGFGGLLAAWVLARHFARVTLVERDVLPSEAAPRKGTPQANQYHILLCGGVSALRQLSLDVVPELVEAGAEIIDSTRDILTLPPMADNWVERYPSEFTWYSCTRYLLEFCLRSRVLRSERIRLLQEHTVRSLVFDATQERVVGVRVARHDTTESIETIEADLVLASCGRVGSAFAQWLKDGGYALPRSLSVQPHVSYSARLFERPTAFPGDWKACRIAPGPRAPEGGIVFPVEGSRWQCIISARGKGPPIACRRKRVLGVRQAAPQPAPLRNPCRRDPRRSDPSVARHDQPTAADRRCRAVARTILAHG